MKTICYLEDLKKQQEALAAQLTSKNVEASSSELLNDLIPKVEDVYHSGQLNVIENTSTLKKSVSGSTIFIDDVSPVEHTMTVKVSSDTVTDLTAVKVIKSNASGEVVAEYTPTADGTVNGVESLYPSTTLTTDTDGVIIDCEYYRDIDADEIITRTVTEYRNDRVESIGNRAFYKCSELISIDFPSVTSICEYAFSYCTKLTTVDFPSVTSIDNSGFSSCSALISVDFPVATSIGNSVFSGCSALTTVDFPSVTSIGIEAFFKCTSLETVDFPVATSIGHRAFSYCSALTKVILRNNSVCSLVNINVFNNCTHINGNDGFIYVPSSLIDEYKTATNWVTYADKFRALEDYTVDGTTTGALDESKVSV